MRKLGELDACGVARPPRRSALLRPRPEVPSTRSPLAVDLPPGGGERSKPKDETVGPFGVPYLASFGKANP